MPPYNNADKYYGHTLSGYSDKIEIELSARTEALKNASWPVNDAESSKANIAQNENNNNSNFEENIRQSEKARALAEEIKKVDGQLQGYDALNEAIAANIEKEFGTMEYNAENLEKIKKYAGLKNSNAQNLDEVLEEIRAGRLQEGERAFLKQLKGNLINEMGKELAEGEKSTIQTAENINAGIDAFSEKEGNNLSSDKGIVNGRDMSFSNFIKIAKNIKNNVRFYFGKVSNNLAERIKNDIGLDVNGYNIAIRSSEVVHGLNQHGNATKEALRGQIAVTESEFEKLPNIFENPDRIILLDKKDYAGRTAFEIHKQIDNYMIAVIGVANGRHSIEIDSVRIVNKKRTVTTVNIAENNPNHTPETSSDQFNNSINDKNTKINEREKTLRENIEEDAAPERQAKYREIVGRYAGEKTIGNMDKLAKRLGSEVIYYLGDDSSEGFYENGKIYLNANLVDVEKNSGQNLVISGQQTESGQNSTNANYWKIFKHEFTHAIEDSKAFKKDFTDWSLASGLYSDFIKNQGFIDEEGNADKAAYADSIRELYRKNGQELDDNGLNRELMAKFVQESDLFENEDSINRLVNENRGFGQRILEWIRNTINKIKGVDPTAENMLKEAERLYEKAVRETEKKGARNSGKQSSIETNEHGKYVKESRELDIKESDLKNNKKIQAVLRKNLLKNGDIKVFADDGSEMTINGRTTWKLAYRNDITDKNGNHKKMNDSEFMEKLKAANHIDELAQISKQHKVVADYKAHSFAKDGFEYRKAFYENKNGEIFQLTISVGKNGEVNTVYNIGKMFKKSASKNSHYSPKGDLLHGPSANKGGAQSFAGDKNISQQDKKSNSIGTNLGEIIKKAQEDKGKKQHSFRQTNEELAESRMNAKAQSYTNKAVNKLLKSFKDSIGMTTYADKGIKEDIRQFANEYVEKGGMSEEEVNKVFDKLYENAMTFNTEYYEQYKELKKALRTTKINISGIKGTDAKDLGRGLRWSYDKGALASDSFYQELSEQYPELFPENIINPEDQLEKMRDVAESIKPTEERLRDLGINYGSSVEERAREAFNTAVEDMNESLADVINFKRERGKRAEAKEQRRAIVDQMHTNIKETKKIFSTSKDLNKKLSQMKNRYLWTEADGNALQRVLNGEITLEELPKNANKKAVNAVYETAKAAAETDQRLKDYKRGVAEQRRDMARELAINSNKYVDKKSGFQWESETPDRNFEDLAKETGDGKKLAEAYIKPIHENEAKATRMKNEYRRKLSEFKLDTKPKYEIRSVDVNGNPVDKLVSESGLVQAYGEGIINDRDLENFKQGYSLTKHMQQAEWTEIGSSRQ